MHVHIVKGDDATLELSCGRCGHKWIRPDSTPASFDATPIRVNDTAVRPKPDQ